MTLPNITDLPTYSGTKINDTDWDNLCQAIIDFMADGSYDINIGAFTAGGEGNMSNNKIINVTDPVNPQDAATKNYVDSSLIKSEYVTNFIANQDTDADHDIKLYRQNSSHPAYIQVNDGAGTYRTVTYNGSGMIKAIDAAWASGITAGDGGMATGVSLSSGLCLYVFLLYNSTSATFNAGFDSDITGAGLLATSAVVSAGFDYISTVPILALPPLDASSNIIDFVSRETEGGGIEVLYQTPIYDINRNNPGTSAVLETLTVAKNSDASLLLHINAASNTPDIIVSPTKMNDDAPTSSNFNFRFNEWNTISIEVDSNRQIRTRQNASNTGNTRTGLTQGYKMARRLL